MPFTPFHFGPGAVLHAIAARHVGFLAFCAANVLIDFESLSNLANNRHSVHASFHTYLGATLTVPATVLLYVGLRAAAPALRAPNTLRWNELSLRPVSIDATLARSRTCSSIA